MLESRVEIDICLVEREYDQLIELCELAIERQPEELSNYWYLGLAHALGGNIELASLVWLPALLESDGSELSVILKNEILRQLEEGEFLKARILYSQLRELTGELDGEIEDRASETVYIYLKRAREEENFLSLLNWNDKNPDIWHELGIFYYNDQRYAQAFKVVEQAINIDNRKAHYHYTMGTILEKEFDFVLSIPIKAYIEAIKLDSNYTDAYNNLGMIYYNSGQLEEAKDNFLKSIASDPSYYRGHINLGDVYLLDQDWDQARYHYQKARELAGELEGISENINTLNKLSSNQLQADLYSGDYYYRKRSQRAIEYYEKALQSTEEQSVKFYLTLIEAYYQLDNNYLKVLEICDRGLKIYPLEMEIHRKKIIFLQETQRIGEAIKAANLAIKLLPDSLTLKLESMRLLPIVYEKQEDIDFYRERYTRQLNDIVSNLDLSTEERTKEAETAIKYQTNFYLQYQGKNDLELQNKYGDLVVKIFENNLGLAPSLSFPDREKDKIRVGYISAHLRHHTVGKLYQGWIKHRNREKFEVYSYAIDSETISDTFRKYYREDSDQFYQFDKSFTFKQIAEQILEDKLHILVYLDIGMNPAITVLAGLRLAPVQCVTWGHPITSGLSTIDYFLSSDLMEPQDGETHYREKLIRLPNLSISYPKPSLPKKTKTRREFGLKEEAIIYLSCQSLFKYLPENDDLFPCVALEVPNSQFAFISYPSPFVTEAFVGRLKKAFARYGLNWEDHVVILNRLSQSDYFQVNLLSDVYLDNISWSGGNTTLEAIACNLPIVTCPSQFMRGRHTYAILKFLGVTETIGSNKDEYINIAVRLGNDKEWREKIKERMKERESSIFEDQTCIKGLENFYRSVVEKN